MTKLFIVPALFAASVSFAGAVTDTPVDSVAVRSHISTRFTARVSVSEGKGDRVVIEYTSTRAGVLASVINGMDYCVDKANQAGLAHPAGTVEVIGCVVAPVKSED